MHYYNVILTEQAEFFVLKKLRLIYENKRNNSFNLEKCKFKRCEIR